MFLFCCATFVCYLMCTKHEQICKDIRSTGQVFNVLGSEVQSAALASLSRKPSVGSPQQHLLYSCHVLFSCFLQSRQSASDADLGERNDRVGRQRTYKIGYKHSKINCKSENEPSPQSTRPLIEVPLPNRVQSCNGQAQEPQSFEIFDWPGQ